MQSRKALACRHTVEALGDGTRSELELAASPVDPAKATCSMQMQATGPHDAQQPQGAVLRKRSI